MGTLQRIDGIIRDKYSGLSRAQVEEAIENGWVRNLEGRPMRKGDKSLPDQIESTQIDACLAELKQGNSELRLELVQEDEWVWVVDKPAGIPSHPVHLSDRATVTQWAVAQAPHLLNEFSEVQPTVAVHRLDTGTSGLLIVAKSRVGYEKWRRKFESKGLIKRYLAWCWGDPSWEIQHVKSYIGHSPSDRTRMVSGYDLELFRGRALLAETDIRVISRNEERSAFLAKIECRTGVTHQIRVHLASLGFPLVGDRLYDDRYIERGLTPPFHLLRAVEIEGEGFKFTLPDPNLKLN